ncbi:MAG: hypothetical protein FJX74_12760 [Armatimonadetes bacterium]|nr:hypothetical protein [Armatimonadota bacterium]
METMLVDGWTRPVVGLLALGLGLAGCLQAQAAPTTLYVAANGSDAWTGAAADPNAAGTDGPFATLARARDEVRKLKAGGDVAGPVTVFVRGGLYALTETLVFEAQDSGTVDAPVTYRAYQAERPILLGGKAIGGWQAHEGRVLKTDVGAQGYRNVYFRQLLCNGRRMDLARYPNRDPDNPVTGGWAYAEGDPVPMYQNVPDEPQNLLRYAEQDARAWAHPEEGEVFVFPRYNWWNNILPVQSLDREKRLLTLAANASYGIRAGDRYYVRNLREELDAPGEWYLDPATWTLYFRPPDDADPATMTVCAPLVRTVLELREGAAHLTFRGLTFECCEGTAIYLQGAHDCLIAACTIRNVGDYNGSGVAITGGANNGVVGCDIHEVGSNAVSLDGGNRDTLEPAGNYADNNYIHHTGVFHKQGVGVAVGGIGNRVSHNLIHDCPRFGIVWGGNDHVLEYNEIRHCNLETADCGAIYSWQVDWSKRGTEIRYNYLHDIIGFGQENGDWTSPHFNWGVYLDDGTCGTHVHHNVVARTILGGTHVHGGRDNVVENNIFIDGRDSQMQYSGYVKGGHPVPMMTETWNQYRGTAAYEEYPGYVELTRSLEDAWQMAGNVFRRNIVCYSEPGARLYAHVNLPFDKTESDYNLIWHDGEPILTGVTAIKEVIGPNLAPNPGFEEGEAGELPANWEWQVRPNDSWAGIDPEVHLAGEKSVRIEGRGTVTDASGQTLCTNFVTPEVPLTSGKTYRLSVAIRAAEADTRCSVVAQSYSPNQFWWGRSAGLNAGSEWQRVEVLFRFPARGDQDWKEGMESIRIRIDVSQGTGTIWVDEVELKEVVAMSEWEAWQALGLDRHSVIADPLFVDRAAGDYRLQPDSPALALGFEPIPIDQIGPYEDELRASWPIVEARGAREQMQIDWSRH